MADVKLDVSVREDLGVGGGVTPKHGGPLRRPVEAIVLDKGESHKAVSAASAQETPMVNAGFLKQTKVKNRTSF